MYHLSCQFCNLVGDSGVYDKLNMHSKNWFILESDDSFFPVMSDDHNNLSRNMVLLNFKNWKCQQESFHYIQDYLRLSLKLMIPCSYLYSSLQLTEHFNYIISSDFLKTVQLLVSPFNRKFREAKAYWQWPTWDRLKLFLQPYIPSYSTVTVCSSKQTEEDSRCSIYVSFLAHPTAWLSKFLEPLVSIPGDQTMPPGQGLLPSLWIDWWSIWWQTWKLGASGERPALWKNTHSREVFWEVGRCLEMTERDMMSLNRYSLGVTHMQILIKRKLTLEQRIETPRTAASLRNINTST